MIDFIKNTIGSMFDFLSTNKQTAAVVSQEHDCFINVLPWTIIDYRSLYWRLCTREHGEGLCVRLGEKLEHLGDRYMLRKEHTVSRLKSGGHAIYSAHGMTFFDIAHHINPTINTGEFVFLAVLSNEKRRIS